MPFDIISQPLHFSGPAGQLPIHADDPLARNLAMLIMGECSELSISEVVRQFDFSRQRYYQLLAAYMREGTSGLQPKSTGPKTNYRRTPELVRRVIAQRFIDPDCSAEVIAQKLRQQQQLPISQRSVERIIADYGLQKKTLRP